ncbi:coagulation factor XI-like [Archocentrus centrarchus]|uniref:coagulation factor XI-like n=1 Tax=Archocentrus centrarchus TaxID=63155 RepID=UPI0011EA2DD9|nr:coagulation factor XI-like [Archocentrus centrarchus]
MVTRLILVGLLSLCSPSSSQECNRALVENMDFPGSDITFLYSPDVKHCQLLCTQHPSCSFFTFVRPDWTRDDRYDRHLFCLRYKCHLKFSWNVARTPIIVRKAGATSGFSHKVHQTEYFDKECQRKLFPSTDIPGNDFLSLPAVSPEHCQILCSAHPRCTYFTHNRYSFICYLKNNPDEMVTSATEAGTSGLPHRSCQLDGNWATVAHEGIDFNGSDIRYEVVDDAEACQRKCTEDPHCQFYTYADENVSDRNYWHRCYLKRVITMPAPPKVTKVTNASSGFSLKNCF